MPANFTGTTRPMTVARLVMVVFGDEQVKGPALSAGHSGEVEVGVLIADGIAGGGLSVERPSRGEPIAMSGPSGHAVGTCHPPDESLHLTR